MTRRFVAMNDAFIDHAIDDGGGMGKSGSGVFLLTGLKRQCGLSNGAAQLGGQRVVAGAMYSGLPGSLFSRFRVRQA